MALRSPWTRHACLSEGSGDSWAATQGAAFLSRSPKLARFSKKPAGASFAKFFTKVSQFGIIFSSSAGLRIFNEKDPPGCCSLSDALLSRFVSSQEAECRRATADYINADLSAGSGEPWS